MFSKMLRELRLKAGLTQQQLSEKLGVAKSTISMYENGNREPAFEDEEKIADFFNVSLNTLRGKSPDKELDDIQMNKIAKVALFGGAAEVTDEMWEEVKNFAKYVESREKNKNDKAE